MVDDEVKKILDSARHPLANNYFLWTRDLVSLMKRKIEDDGMTIKEFAELVNKEYWSVFKVCKKYGIRSKRSVKPLSDEQKEEIIKKYKKGATVAELCKEYCKGQASVRYILIVSGVYIKKFRNRVI